MYTYTKMVLDGSGRSVPFEEAMNKKDLIFLIQEADTDFDKIVEFIARYLDDEKCTQILARHAEWYRRCRRSYGTSKLVRSLLDEDFYGMGDNE